MFKVNSFGNMIDKDYRIENNVMYIDSPRTLTDRERLWLLMDNKRMIHMPRYEDDEIMFHYERLTFKEWWKNKWFWISEFFLKIWERITER